jgi:hypothetical protein
LEKVHRKTNKGKNNYIAHPLNLGSVDLKGVEIDEK